MDVSCALVKAGDIMHLTFALIVCDFLAIVSADPANDHLIWRKSYRKRQSKGLLGLKAIVGSGS